MTAKRAGLAEGYAPEGRAGIVLSADPALRRRAGIVLVAGHAPGRRAGTVLAKGTGSREGERGWKPGWHISPGEGSDGGTGLSSWRCRPPLPCALCQAV